MQLPIVKPAPLVTTHAAAFRDLFENRCQFRHFEHYLTGLMVLPNKSMANIARCVVASSDKTNVSRYFSRDRWLEERVNDRRVAYMLQHTKPVRLTKEASALIVDDTLCEHVGNLFDYIDRHYDHGDQAYPLAHHPVTSHYVSGPVRFPVDLRLYRRYEEAAQWEAFVRKHFPERDIPKKKKERAQFHKTVDPTLLQDPAFQALQAQFQTKIELAIELVEAAIGRKLPFGVCYLIVGIWRKILSPVCAAARKIGLAFSKRTATSRRTVLYSKTRPANAFRYQARILRWKTWLRSSRPTPIARSSSASRPTTPLPSPCGFPI